MMAERDTQAQRIQRLEVALAKAIEAAKKAGLARVKRKPPLTPPPVDLFHPDALNIPDSPRIVPSLSSPLPIPAGLPPGSMQLNAHTRPLPVPALGLQAQMPTPPGLPPDI